VRLWRAHGLGNDYLVLDDGPPLDGPLVQAICDRHRGIGGDGVLEPRDGEGADFGVRIWNPDGSVAEKSGNGLRIFARWLVDRRSAPGRFTVWTGHDTVTCTVTDALISVQMGRATLDPASVPVLAPGPVRAARWTVEGVQVEATVLSVGNPHCVLFVDDADLDSLPWRAWGRALETDARFPNRINVQIARQVGPATLELRIWERGAGATQASGSSSCAVAAAAVLTGRCQPGRLVLQMPGGTLHVTVEPDLSLDLEGPVEPVGLIHVAPSWLQPRLE
jgi:diaminopimelate epimerase